MRKSAAEWCVKCGMWNVSLACILGVLLHRDVPKGVMTHERLNSLSRLLGIAKFVTTK